MIICIFQWSSSKLSVFTSDDDMQANIRTYGKFCSLFEEEVAKVEQELAKVDKVAKVEQELVNITEVILTIITMITLIMTMVNGYDQRFFTKSHFW